MKICLLHHSIDQYKTKISLQSSSFQHIQQHLFISYLNSQCLNIYIYLATCQHHEWRSQYNGWLCYGCKNPQFICTKNLHEKLI